MALTAELENLITELAKADPAGAKEMRASLEKYPTLQTKVQEGVLRQSDFDRKHNELKADVEYGKTMKAWADTNKPEYERMVEENRKAKEEVAELERKVALASGSAAAAAAAAGGNVDAAALTATVLDKLKGQYATPTEINALVAAEAKKYNEEFFKTTFPNAAKWQAEYTNAQLQYHAETGKYLDDEVFTKFMLDAKIASPKKGFEDFMAPARQAKEVEDKAEIRAKEILAERGGGFPGSSGSPGGGHLQVRLTKKDAADPLFNKDAELGDGSLAAMAATELATEGH